MRFTDALALRAEADTLDAKAETLKSGRLGKRDALRRSTIEDSLRRSKQPEPTPRRAPTGLDSNGQTRADMYGSTWYARLRSGTTFGQQGGTGRDVRRANRFGRGGIKPFRSRIQRTRRRQRTGGVK